MNITDKLLIKLKDNRNAIVVRVDRPEKTIVCFSTQVGCPVRCYFCAATTFNRSLTVEEMKEQIDTALSIRDVSNKSILLSAMGQGEPAYCSDELSKVFNNYPGMRTAVSTSGPSVRLVEKLKCAVGDNTKIQYSLHSGIEKTRNKIIPKVSATPHEILKVLVNHPVVEINFVLWDNINDSDEEAYAAIGVLKSVPRNWNIKLNQANEWPGSPKPSFRMDTWKSYLINEGFNVEYYATDGSNKQSACGQISF